MDTPRDVIAAAMDEEIMMYKSDHENADTIIAALTAAGYSIIKIIETVARPLPFDSDGERSTEGGDV